VFSKAKSLASY